MQIKEVTFRLRKDFSAIMACEECGHEQKLSGGYDDNYYHHHVIPSLICESCGQSRNSARSLSASQQRGDG